MIVDAHTHVFSDVVLQRRAELAERERWFGALNPPGTRRLASPARLIATMDAAGVDVAVALSFGWSSQGLCVEQNDCVLTAAARYPGRLVPFCTVQPRAGATAMRELERVAALGCRGVGELFPDGQDFSLADERIVVPLLEACAALSLALLVHGSEPLGRRYPGKGQTTPDKLIALAALAVRHAPKLPIICAHLGGGLPFYELMPEVRVLTENVYYDTGAAAYLYEPNALTQVSALAPGRLLFGSDYPVIGMRRMLEFAAAAALPEDERQSVLGGTASALFHLQPHGG